MPVGEIFVSVNFNNIQKDGCRLVVVKEGNISLLGRYLMKLFKLRVQSAKISNVSNVVVKEKELDKLLKKYEPLFRDELGLYKYEKVELEVESQIKPVFCKPRPVPFAFKEMLENELDELEKRGVISQVKNAEWGTPLVPILKNNGKLRLCADYKVTVNKYLKEVKHPLPRIEELFTALQGGEFFTKLDLASAYNQLELADNTKLLLAWSTHRGIYKLNRLPYGTKPAVAIFQKIIEKLLQGLDGVIAFVDDIVVTMRKYNRAF